MHRETQWHFPHLKAKLLAREKKNLKASSSQLGDLFKAFKWRCATIYSETTRTTYHCPSFVCIHQLVLCCCCCWVVFFRWNNSLEDAGFSNIVWNILYTMQSTSFQFFFKLTEFKKSKVVIFLAIFHLFCSLPLCLKEGEGDVKKVFFVVACWVKKRLLKLLFFPPFFPLNWIKNDTLRSLTFLFPVFCEKRKKRADLYLLDKIFFYLSVVFSGINWNYQG